VGLRRRLVPFRSARKRDPRPYLEPAGEAGATPAAVCRHRLRSAPLPSWPSGQVAPPSRSDSGSQAPEPTTRRRDPRGRRELFRSSQEPRPLFQGSLQRLEGAEGAEPEARSNAPAPRPPPHPAGPDFAFSPPPLELLYWPENRQFLGLAGERRCAVPELRERHRRAIETALRILAVGAFPAGYPFLDLTAERQKIEKSWRTPGVEVESSIPRGGDLLKLGERLVHVLHFMGTAPFRA